MASIRSLYLITSDNKLILSRSYPTMEQRQKRILKDDYIQIPEDEEISNLLYNQIIKEDLFQEKLKEEEYKENVELDQNKFKSLLQFVDFDINDLDNINYFSESPINSITLDSGDKLWPCVYVKYLQIYAFAFPTIDKNELNKIREEVSNTFKTTNESSYDFREKKMYEHKDISIIGAFNLLESILKFIFSNKIFEESKLQALITNLAPFGTIIETNINSVIDKLQNVNNKFVSSSIFSKKLNTIDDHTKHPGWATRINTYNTKEKLYINIKEELKAVQFPNNKLVGMILCDVQCKADISSIGCKITLPIKEKKNKYIKNMRVHTCAVIQDQFDKNEGARIVFTPPQEQFTLLVFEIDNIHEKKLPIYGRFDLKELDDNKVVFLLELHISKNIIGKFDYFYITIPLAHYGKIVDTNTNVQVGEVDVINQKTTLIWNLQNDVLYSPIVFSGSVEYTKKNTIENIQDNKHYESSNEIDKIKSNILPTYSNQQNESNGTINIEEMIKQNNNKIKKSSDIMSTNCYCNIHYRLENYNFNVLEIDKSSISFHPIICPKIEIKSEFISNEFKIWNNLSFFDYDITQKKKDFSHNLQDIVIEEKEDCSSTIRSKRY